MNTKELNRRLIELGASKNQLGSKMVAMMLTIFAETEYPAKEAYECLLEYRKEAEDLKYEAEWRLDNKRREIVDKEIACERKLKGIEEQKKSLEALQELETAEARDRLRLATIFDEKVVVDNEFQQTEYIRGLGMILGEKQKQ